MTHALLTSRFVSYKWGEGEAALSLQQEDKHIQLIWGQGSSTGGQSHPFSPHTGT